MRLICSSNQADILFSSIIYSYIKHLNRVPFKFVPDPFLGITISRSTYNIGIWMLNRLVKFLLVIPWMALVPRILRFTDFEDLNIAALACNFCSPAAECIDDLQSQMGLFFVHKGPSLLNAQS